MFMPKLKRPLPMPLVESGATSSSAAVDRRVTAKTFPTVKNFLQNIRDVPERTWREEREAVWETAIRRWVSLLESWDDSRVTLASALKSKTSFTEKAQIAVDVFFNKAPQTLIKRVNSLAKLTNELGASGKYFPCNEDEFYQFLRSEVDSKCSASRLKAYFEAVVFARYVLNMECLQPLVDSRRCLGAASQSAVTCPKQASPFTVKQLKRNGFMKSCAKPVNHGTKLWPAWFSFAFTADRGGRMLSMLKTWLVIMTATMNCVAWRSRQQCIRQLVLFSSDTCFYRSQHRQLVWLMMIGDLNGWRLEINCPFLTWRNIHCFLPQTVHWIPRGGPYPRLKPRSGCCICLEVIVLTSTAELLVTRANPLFSVFWPRGELSWRIAWFLDITPIGSGWHSLTVVMHWRVPWLCYPTFWEK